MPTSDPGVVTYEQYNLNKGYLMPLDLGFRADKMEEDNTSVLGSL